MDKEELIDFEKDIEAHFLAGEIHAPVHFSAGNESQLIEIFKDIKPTDWVFSNHRSHYHALLHGIDKDWLKKEILAGRSMHINTKKFMTSSIVNGCTPIAVGMAMALKEKGSKDKVWCFVGDMAASVGVFYECSKYARMRQLPVTFIIEDNGLSTNTPTVSTWGGFTISNEPNIIYYKYERGCAHINVSGKWVTFR